MKKYLIPLLHVGFWGCYFILAMVILGVLHAQEGEPMDEVRVERSFTIIMFFALVPSAISFYAFYFWLFPRFLKKKKFLKAELYGVLVSLAAGTIGFGLLTMRFGPDCGVEETDDPMIGIILFIAFIALISGIIAWVIQGFITWFEEIKLKESLKQKNQEMELALVKAQLDPHFLFNTINNIDVLMLKDAHLASTYLNKLSDIMRFMLYETKTDEIPLHKELEYIEKYIDLQKIRTANETYVNYTVEGKPGDRKIAPMIFIPFIENAFKHTNNKKLDNAINIKIGIENGTVNLECENKFSLNGKVEEGSNGLGNELIRKRLNLIYPENHNLEVQRDNNIYKVSLSISNG